MATFLMIHPNLDIYGGGEKVCHQIIKTLIDNGEEVGLLTFDFDVDQYNSIMGDQFPETVKIHSLGKRLEVEPPFTLYKRRRNILKLINKYSDKLHYDFTFFTQSIYSLKKSYLENVRGNMAYVHFPDLHDDYKNSSLRRKIYLWYYKCWIEQAIKSLNLVFCNSNYTKEKIEEYWGRFGIRAPIVVYPPVNLDAFWCDKPIKERRKRVTYVGRFIPQKRHDIIKKLATDLPEYEFLSIGGLRESEAAWFKNFSQDAPVNYELKPNLPSQELIELLHDSRVYVHLMEGEHFGIAPMEALASGCVSLVHSSGGTVEFIPEEFRWQNYEDLKKKVVQYLSHTDNGVGWAETRNKLWGRLSPLKPEVFRENIWMGLQKIIRE